MPREKEAFRDQLARLDEAFPGKELLKRGEICTYLGISRDAQRAHYQFVGPFISKVELARRLCL